MIAAASGFFLVPLADEVEDLPAAFAGRDVADMAQLFRPVGEVFIFDDVAKPVPVVALAQVEQPSLIIDAFA